MSWPLARMTSNLFMALAVALSVNGRLRFLRISTHPFQASIGSQSGSGGSIEGLLSGLLFVFISGIGLPFWAASFAFLGKWACSLRQVGEYHFVRS